MDGRQQRGIQIAAGQANEVLCKVLAHNIVCVAQAAIEFGCEAEFCKARSA